MALPKLIIYLKKYFQNTADEFNILCNFISILDFFIFNHQEVQICFFGLVWRQVVSNMENAEYCLFFIISNQNISLSHFRLKERVVYLHLWLNKQRSCESVCLPNEPWNYIWGTSLKGFVRIKFITRLDLNCKTTKYFINLTYHH